MSSLNDSDSDTSTVPLFDPSEFPALTNDVSPSSSSRGSNMYLGIVRPVPAEIEEFILSPEDFPALPNTNKSSEGSSLVSNDENEENNWGSVSDQESSSNSSDSERILEEDLDHMKNFLNNLIFNSDSDKEGDSSDSEKKKKPKPNITFVGDKAENIPKYLLKDQFGLVGLLRFLRTANNDPDLVSLPAGQDIDNLGLNLDSSENLYPTFGGPWAAGPSQPQQDDDDFEAPPEYVFDRYMRDTFVPERLEKYKEELSLAAKDL